MHPVSKWASDERTYYTHIHIFLFKTHRTVYDGFNYICFPACSGGRPARTRWDEYFCIIRSIARSPFAYWVHSLVPCIRIACSPNFLDVQWIRSQPRCEIHGNKYIPQSNRIARSRTNSKIFIPACSGGTAVGPRDPYIKFFIYFFGFY